MSAAPPEAQTQAPPADIMAIVEALKPLFDQEGVPDDPQIRAALAEKLMQENPELVQAALAKMQSGAAPAPTGGGVPPEVAQMFGGGGQM
jgi:hypothetical protein